MLTKTKKIALLTTGLAGTLLATTVAGIALSSCTFQVVDPNGNNSNSGTSENENAAWYTTKIDWTDQAQLATLVIDDQGLVYANPAKTELIGVVPNFPGDFSGGFANIVIPASVKAITGYVNVTHPNDSSTTTNTNRGAFEGMTSLTNVTFASNNVTRIGAQAFKGCSNLATISLPSSVSYIGTSAFENCNKLNTINLQNVSYIGNSAFKSAFSSIPTSSVELNVEKVNYVGTNAFESTSGLKTINFNNNTVLQTVANSAFLNSGITSLDLSQATKLLTIGDSAFQGCASLTEVKVPKSLTSFGNNVFGNVSSSNSTATTSLTTIDLSATQVTQLPNGLFQGCTSLSNVKLPAGLTEIGETAFQGATSLTAIDIPSSVTTLGGSAFAGSGLTAIDLSQTAITQIDNAVFQNTASLTDVKLPTRITSIGTRTFFNSAITALDLSKTALTTIGQGAFANTTSLTALTVPKSLSEITSSNNANNDVNATFTGSGLTALDLSQTQIQTINVSTFNGATKLETVKLPSTVTRINDNAFKNTTALKTLTQEKPAASETPAPGPTGRATDNQLASTLKKIDTRAFQGTGLESIDLSETGILGTGETTALGNSAFQDAVNLSNVKLPNGLIAIPAASFAGTVKLTSIEIPNTVNRINAGNSQFKGAFQGSGLTSIDLSQTKVTGVTTDNTDGAWPSYNGTDAQCGTFSNMPNLTTVTLPANLTSIPKDAFANSAKLATVKFGAADANNGGGSGPSGRAVTGTDNAITLPSGITRVDANAFAGTKASTVDLSQVTGLTTISDSVFQNMTSLTEVKLPSSITTINQSAFQNDVALKTLTQAEAAANGGGAQTRDGEAATPTANTATFGSKLISIGNNAFYGTGFTTVDLSLAGTTTSGSTTTPTTPLTVGSGAFTNMASLTEVKLPANADINPTYFGNPTDAEGAEPKLTSITYGDGTATATATIGDATISSLNFSKIKNSTIEIKSSVGGSSITFTGGVFNGNADMTTLKLNVTATNGNNPLWNFNLGTAPTATNTTEAYKTAPLGNNSALTNIELSGLHNQTQTSSGTNTGNQWSRISTNCWAQVASIINMFSSGETTTSGSTPTKAKNLDLWAVGSTGATNSWINTDLIAPTTTGGTDGTVNQGWEIQLPSGTTGGQPLAESTQTATLTHNGVNWKYSNPKGGTTGRADQTNEITITGTGIKIYKAMNGQNGYQTYIGKEDGTGTGITVKITLVPNTLPASSPQTAKK